MTNTINRRKLLSVTGQSLLLVGMPKLAYAKSNKNIDILNKENVGDWTTRKVKTKINPPNSVSAVMIPLPRLTDTTYQKFLDMQFAGNFKSAQVIRDPVYGADALQVNFEKIRNPEVNINFTVQTRNRTAPEPKSATEDVSIYLKPTKHMPTDGLVKQTADKITRHIKSPDAKALAIYNWVIDNTFRDPKVKGCGIGDINNMLSTGNLGGKCADINSLFVGLCRAAGVPAREFFGIRNGDSEQFKSIGKSGVISKAQHCRAEFFSEKKTWIAVDPADVRKVVLEENLKLEDPKVLSLRKKFFGFWEMNWIAYNHARDFKFSQGQDREFNFFMYPQSFGADVDSLSPDDFKYSIETLS